MPTRDDPYCRQPYGRHEFLSLPCFEVDEDRCIHCGKERWELEEEDETCQEKQEQ